MDTQTTFDNVSTRFDLPFLFAGQTQKEFFVNEALARIDILLHPNVLSELSEPPIEPADGKTWLIGHPATGDWEGKDGQIAGRIAGHWQFARPSNGMRIFDESQNQSLIYIDGWQRLAAPAVPSGGATIDHGLRDAFTKLIEALTIAGIFSGDG